MKVLYAAFRENPSDPDGGSGTDYQFYQAMRRAGLDVHVVGPFPGPFPVYERALRTLYHKITGRQYFPWDFTSSWQASRAVNQAEQVWQPDVVFAFFPTPLMRYRGTAPYVLATDTTSLGKQAAGFDYGRTVLRQLVALERRVARRSARVITFSAWCRDEMRERYGIDPKKIEVLPIPAALPLSSVPDEIDIECEKRLPETGLNGLPRFAPDNPLRLLLVGRDFERKGVDIAIETTRLLNAQGLVAELTVCGCRGAASPHVRYVGPYRKSEAKGLAAYVELYRRAHLLMHPARFEPAGIVPGEAAAFATPTITHAGLGGLATTVSNGESGIVLPGGAPAEAYAEAVALLVGEPDRYYALCRSARARYERELNWDAAGKRVVAVLADAAHRRILTGDALQETT